MTVDGEQERQAETATGRREDERKRGLPLQKEEEQRKGRGVVSELVSSQYSLTEAERIVIIFFEEV